MHEASAQDGYVSMEVDPGLAYDTEATFEQAIDLHERIDRPNLYVKIPATEPGLPAIEDCIAARHVDQRHADLLARALPEVVEAYLRGLERLVAGGGDPAKVRSVASFFVSRVDTEADKRLEAIGTEEALGLRGKLAIANAKLAYEHYLAGRSPARAGSASRARARCRSAACGPRPRPRTRPTATCSTSRS